MTYLNNTALLLFSKTAVVEAAGKKLLKGNARQNFLVADALIKRSRTIATQSGLPLFVHTEAEQTGNTFGEKLYRSGVSIFQQGFEKIIVIGNDCLQLSAQHICHAASQLEIGDQVLAPTKKGGVYLMGFCKSGFKKDIENIRWQTEYAYHDLILLAAVKNASVYHLPYLDDVNHYSDLLPEAGLLSPLDKFKILVQSILASFYKINFTLFKFLLLKSFDAAGLRAPPIVA